MKSALANFQTLRLKHAASGLQSRRGFVLPNAQEQVHEKTDLDLVTWLVIKNPTA